MTLSHEDFAKALRHGARLVELKTDGSAEAAIIQEVQWDHLGKEVLHVDFRRVSKDERIVVPVPLDLRGIAPGVSGGGVLDQPLHVINIECLVTAVPRGDPRQHRRTANWAGHPREGPEAAGRTSRRWAIPTPSWSR